MRLKLAQAYPPIGRLAMQFGLAFALAMGAAGGIAFLTARHQLMDELDEQLAHERDKLIVPGAANDSAALKQRILARRARKLITNRGNLLYAPDGHAVLGGLDLAPPPTGFSEITFRDGSPKWHSGRALAVRLPDGGRLVVVAHSDIATNMREMLASGIVALMTMASLAGVAATWVLAHQISGRLGRTLAAADAIAKGNLNRRIPMTGLDGIFAEQAASLNHMLDRMEQMLRSQRQFASHLAHDLRTPLTRLRGDLRDCRPLVGSQGLGALERAERECRSIIAIFDALLRLSEIEAGAAPTAMAPLALAAMIEDVAETMEPVIADAGSTLTIGKLAPAHVLADRGLMQQLLVNLIENIALHTPAGTSATLNLAQEGDWAVVTISDNGPGIAPDARARVIQPFERGTGALKSGNGLGLAIAQAIMRFHHGRLELADNQPGLAVRLYFATMGEGPQGAQRNSATF